MHIQIRLLGSFGLNDGVPYNAGTNGSLCLICKQGTEDVTNFLRTDLVSRMHIQIRRLGSFGLNDGVPYHAGTNCSLCLICKQGTDNVTHFLRTDLVNRMHIQIRLLGSFGLNDRMIVYHTTLKQMVPSVLSANRVQKM